MFAGFTHEPAIDLAEHAHQHHPGEPDVLAALATLAIDVGDAYGAQRLLVHLTRANRNHPERMVQLRRLAELRGAARQAANQQQVAA